MFFSYKINYNSTYYQTNKWDKGEFKYFTTLEDFFNSQVAHPGLVAALRAAMRSGSYEWEAPDGEALYVEELAPALEDQGFTFESGSSSAEG